MCSTVWGWGCKQEVNTAIPGSSNALVLLKTLSKRSRYLVGIWMVLKNFKLIWTAGKWDTIAMGGPWGGFTNGPENGRAVKGKLGNFQHYLRMGDFFSRKEMVLALRTGGFLDLTLIMGLVYRAGILRACKLEGFSAFLPFTHPKCIGISKKNNSKNTQK